MRKVATSAITRVCLPWIGTLASPMLAGTRSSSSWMNSTPMLSRRSLLPQSSLLRPGLRRPLVLPRDSHRRASSLSSSTTRIRTAATYARSSCRPPPLPPTVSQPVVTTHSAIIGSRFQMVRTGSRHAPESPLVLAVLACAATSRTAHRRSHPLLLVGSAKLPGRLRLPHHHPRTRLGALELKHLVSLWEAHA